MKLVYFQGTSKSLGVSTEKRKRQVGVNSCTVTWVLRRICVFNHVFVYQSHQPTPVSTTSTLDDREGYLLLLSASDFRFLPYFYYITRCWIKELTCDCQCEETDR